MSGTGVQAICIHEEDYGMLWKHWDFRTGHSEVRRSRRLVVSSVSTVGNYGALVDSISLLLLIDCH